MAVLHKTRNEVQPSTWLGNFPMRARLFPGCKMAASTVYKHRVLGFAILHPGNTHALIGKFCNYVLGRTSFRERVYGDWSPYIQSPWSPLSRLDSMIHTVGPRSRIIFLFSEFSVVEGSSYLQLILRASAHIVEKVQIPLPWLTCLSVCMRRKRRCAILFPSRSLASWYRKGHVAIFLPRHSCMRERLVPIPLVLHASSLQSCLISMVTMHAFSTVPKFRFQAVVYRVEIEKYASLDFVQKRREADDNFKFTKYVVMEIIPLFSIF